ncbi:MAG: LysR family transcriptional regulator [Kaiparowitsia implicata GSE-PSE-MK54-09C]|jgi:DNA-binding transcriptional LysR family regulator|nr:LysR family transcriptional regulator [Kaiparowitsia implicata GSE-PSE-MK54-09C]
MSINMMDIKDLRCFIVLAEELNFRRAAEKLHMSQPPLTRLIGQLERELGITLFERTTRRVELTEAGQSLLREARGLILCADETARRIRHATSEASNRLRVGYVPLALYTVLPQFLDQCRKDFPELELDLRERTTDMQLSELCSAEIDIGFIYMPVYSNLLAVKSVYREPMKLAVPNSHPMANHSGVKLTDFASDVLIMHSRAENPAMYDDILRCCTVAGFSPRILQKADDQSCMALLMAGQGVHFIASGVECLEPNGLKHLAISGTAPTLELAIAWRQEDPSSATKSLVSQIPGV